MRLLLAIFVFLVASCESTVIHECTNGALGVESAVEFARDQWPDIRENITMLTIVCADQDVIESVSHCGLTRAERLESCTARKYTLGTPALIHISNDEDAAISTCHELAHLRPVAWDSADGCQSHEQSCGYSTAQVDRCEQAVFDSRQ